MKRLRRNEKKKRDWIMVSSQGPESGTRREETDMSEGQLE